MIKPGEIRQDINRIIACLVEIGLASDQNFVSERAHPNGYLSITFSKAQHVSIAIKNRPYVEIYRDLASARAYNVRMLDGALIQMMYMFRNEELERHRLAFFPAPHLHEFQNDPEIYIADEIYGNVVARNIVPFPIRFDYDAREGVAKELQHPKSHLTLGQYDNCRIPVTAPLTPIRFMDFILRSFYNTDSDSYTKDLPRCERYFDQCILPAEQQVVHVMIPA